MARNRFVRRSDFSAQRGLERTIYCEADSQFRPAPQIVVDGVEHVRLFQPEGFAIEINQFQELLCADFKRVGQQERVPLPLYRLNTQTNKQVRIRRLGPYLSQRQLRFKSPIPRNRTLSPAVERLPCGRP
jgi:hypothetical protein